MELVIYVFFNLLEMLSRDEAGRHTTRKQGIHYRGSRELHTLN
jgi:hypothetical protein